MLHGVSVFKSGVTAIVSRYIHMRSLFFSFSDSC